MRYIYYSITRRDEKLKTKLLTTGKSVRSLELTSICDIKFLTLRKKITIDGRAIARNNS